MDGKSLASLVVVLFLLGAVAYYDGRTERKDQTTLPIWVAFFIYLMVLAWGTFLHYYAHVGWWWVAGALVSCLLVEIVAFCAGYSALEQSYYRKGEDFYP